MTYMLNAIKEFVVLYASEQRLVSVFDNQIITPWVVYQLFHFNLHNSAYLANAIDSWVQLRPSLVFIG